MKKNYVMTETMAEIIKDNKTIDKALKCKSETRLVDDMDKNDSSNNPMLDTIKSINGLFKCLVPKNVTDHQQFKADLQKAVFAYSVYDAMPRFVELSELESKVKETKEYRLLSDDDKALVLQPIIDARTSLNDALILIRDACPEFRDDKKKQWATYTTILSDIPRFTRMLAWLIIPTLGPSQGKGSKRTYRVHFDGQDAMLQTLRLFGKQAREKCNITGKGEPATNCKNAIVEFFNGCTASPYTKQFEIRVSNIALFDCLNAVYSGRKLSKKTGTFDVKVNDDYTTLYQVMAAVFGTCLGLDTKEVEEANTEDFQLNL